MGFLCGVGGGNEFLLAGKGRVASRQRTNERSMFIASTRLSLAFCRNEECNRGSIVKIVLVVLTHLPGYHVSPVSICCISRDWFVRHSRGTYIHVRRELLPLRDLRLWGSLRGVCGGSGGGHKRETRGGGIISVFAWSVGGDGKEGW